jgi:hypothetical protein
MVLKMKTSLIGCLLLLNSFAFGQKSSELEIYNISIDSMGDLKWTISYIQDLRGGSQQIEHMKGDKWVVIEDFGWATAPGKEWTPSKNKSSKRDSVRVKFHKGVNKYRIRASVHGEKIISSEVQLISKVANDDNSVWIMGNEIIMDKKEYYEIINQSGEVVLKGEGKKINISSLGKGSYFLYNKKETKKFIK